MKAVLIVVMLSVFVVGCVSLKPASVNACQGKFTPINSGQR